MPKELEGNRSYHAILRALGIQNPGAAPIGLPVQLIALADDVTRLHRPLGLEQFGIRIVEATVLLERSGVAIRPGRGGLWINTFWPQAAPPTHLFYRDDTTVLTGTTDQSGTAAWRTGDANVEDERSQWTSFHMTPAALSIPATAPFLPGSTFVHRWVFTRELYIAPGQRVIIVGGDNDTLFDVTFWYQEVPGDAGD